METLYEQIAYASNYANNEFFLFQEGSVWAVSRQVQGLGTT